MNDILNKLGLSKLFSASPKKTQQPFLQSPIPGTNPATNDFAFATANATPGDYAVHGVANGMVSGSTNVSTGKNYKKIKNVLKNTKLLLSIVIGIVVIAIASIAVGNLTKSQPKTVAGIQDNKINIQNAKATQQLNREFQFPLKDAGGKVVSKLKYSIQTVELRDEIIIKGQKATAVKGRTFLVLNLKITNDYNKSIQINARDYIRLIVNNSSEKLAPDIHNDPVEIQAISTKYTRLGFPINDTDSNLTLQVGEIDGKKELINLNLK